MSIVSWLHWITERGLLSTGFLRDVQDAPVMRPIDFRDLMAISWDDNVYCISKESRSKPGVVFFRFPVTVLSGLSRDAYKALLDEFDGEEVDCGGEFIQRSDEPYLQGGTGIVFGTLQQIASIIQEAQRKDELEIGKLQIGCQAKGHEIMPLPWAKLSQVHQGPGYRQIDMQAFRRDVKEQRDKGVRNISLPSLYPARLPLTDASTGLIQWANEYGSLPVEPDQGELQLLF